MVEKIVTQGTVDVQKPVKKTTKAVRNRSGHKVELVIDGKVVVFLPGKVVEVPTEFQIPGGLGLFVK